MSRPDPLAEVQECYEQARESFAEAHRIMDRERRFSEGEHYLDDDGDVNLARIQPKTEALVRVLNFKVGKVTAGPLYFETRPADPNPDPNDPDDVMLSEYGTRLVESNISNPCNRYNATRYRVAWGGFSARMGAAELSFNSQVGLHGLSLWSNIPRESLMWDPSFLDLHDPRCPWALHISDMALSEIQGKKGWKNRRDVQADGGMAPYVETRADSRLLNDYGLQSRKPKDSACIIKLWQRNRPSLYREKSFDALPEAARYMVCGAINEDGTVAPGCGYMTPTQGESGEVYQETSARGLNPMTGQEEGGCPTCGGDMTRIDGQARGEMVSSYGRGRLVIVAPFSKVVLYDGKWPQRLRSFPYWVFRPSLRDTTAFGPSETTTKWSLQALDDASLRMGWEQMQRNRDVTIMPRIGIEDANGNPYDWLTSFGPMFYTGDAPLGAGSVQHYQGSGLNAAMVAWRQMIRGAFREDEGTNDLSPSVGTDGPKDITATTMTIYNETGNVPLDAQKRIWQEEESLALGLLLDMELETCTDERATEMWGMEGPQMLALLRARSAHIQVLDQPSLAKLDENKMRALTMFAQIPNPGLRRVLARRMNLSMADVREIEKALQPPMPMPMDGGGIPAGAPEMAPPPTAVGTGGF